MLMNCIFIKCSHCMENVNVFLHVKCNLQQLVMNKSLCQKPSLITRWKATFPILSILAPFSCGNLNFSPHDYSSSTFPLQYYLFVILFLSYLLLKNCSFDVKQQSINEPIKQCKLGIKTSLRQPNERDEIFMIRVEISFIYNIKYVQNTWRQITSWKILIKPANYLKIKKTKRHILRNRKPENRIKLTFISSFITYIKIIRVYELLSELIVIILNKMSSCRLPIIINVEDLQSHIKVTTDYL